MAPPTQETIERLQAADGGYGRNTVLQALLESGGNPNAIDQQTTCPVLHTAAWHDAVDVVKVLLEFKADINAKELRMGTPPINSALAAATAFAPPEKTFSTLVNLVRLPIRLPIPS